MRIRQKPLGAEPVSPCAVAADLSALSVPQNQMFSEKAQTS